MPNWLDEEILPEAQAPELSPQSGANDRLEATLAALYNSLVPRTPNDMVFDASLGALGGAALKGAGAIGKAWKAMDSAPVDMGRRGAMEQLGKTGGVGALGAGYGAAKKYDEIADLRRLRDVEEKVYRSTPDPAEVSPLGSISPKGQANWRAAREAMFEEGNTIHDRLGYNAGWDERGSPSALRRVYDENPDALDLQDVDLRYPHEKLLDALSERFGRGQ